MLYEDAYKYLVKIKNKEMTIEELNNQISQTEQFEKFDGGSLADCIIKEKDKEYCCFNSYTNNKNQVIAIDIEFKKVSDFKIIKEMLWDDVNECNDIAIIVKNVYIYE